VNAARQISNVGLIGTGATVGGLYIYGLKKHDTHAHEAGFLGTESFVSSFVMKELVNVASGRLRPEEGNGHGDFFVNHSFDSSFPSGHAMLTWSMATVLADEYPSKKSRIFGIPSVQPGCNSRCGEKTLYIGCDCRERGRLSHWALRFPRPPPRGQLILSCAHEPGAIRVKTARIP
jgi:hypothetical protein